jgi:dihydropteroate synthase
MGILNVTPDSFADGGRWADPAAAVARGVEMALAGADVIDVGGESTRPGYEPVPAAEQIARVVPVLEGLRARFAGPISVDTSLAAVAAEALRAGADWVNDTTALAGDPAMARLVAEQGCPVVLMHRFVPPRRPGDARGGQALIAELAAALRARMEHALAAGIAVDRILLDPGVGFGTLPQDSVAIVARTAALRALGRPLVVGPSRKSFLGQLTGRPVGERLHATAAAVAALALAGADLVRVHDVAEMRDVVAVADALRREASG